VQFSLDVTWDLEQETFFGAGKLFIVRVVILEKQKEKDMSVCSCLPGDATSASTFTAVSFLLGLVR
jgi:hypothetical protein